MKDVGIIGLEIHFPRCYVEQHKLGTPSSYSSEEHNQVGKGKYTVGLGQDQLSFAYDFEDVNSMALTAVDRLMRNYGVEASRIGRLEIGTETLIDKSKSTKTVLMTLFKDNHDIEGATSVNACYGATNALFNALNWVRSDTWDGRLAIVVACDIAVYEKGPARPTGGAGAVAMLIGPNATYIIDPIRSTYIDHQYDFYKPIPGSQYPIVDGSLSINCYLKALEECHKTLKKKVRSASNTDISMLDFDYMCFHCPFYKMIQKAFTKLCELDKASRSPEEEKQLFMKKVHPSLYLSKHLGNIYTGSLYTGLISLTMQPNMAGKRILMFSYGSGLMSSMFTIRVKGDLQTMRKLIDFEGRLSRRVEISPHDFDAILLEKQKRYGKVLGDLNVKQELLEDGAFYLVQVDEKMRRQYRQVKPKETIGIKKKQISLTAIERIEAMNHQISVEDQFSGFYKLPVDKRVQKVQERVPNLDVELLKSGGLSLNQADLMIQNVIGRLSLPFAVATNFNINKKSYIIPMCIEEPSVVAACSSVAKMIGNNGFSTSSMPGVMIGQVYLPDCEVSELHLLSNNKKKILQYLNNSVESLVKRGGGVEDLRTRKIGQRQYVAEILVNVKEAMGANIVNTLCEKLKTEITQYGIKCGIAILSNYCTERMALSTFQIPLKDLEWKGHDGIEVAQKILQAYEFARLDKHRATTHNKGILNGIDGVCLAVGQDWRAVESAAHSHASQSGKYMPLSHYEIIDRKGQAFFKGTLELPMAVGSIGGALQKNPIYRQSLEILGNPDSKQLAEIIVTVGLAQNFAALRALAIEGIQKGHMALHSRSIAVKAGVPRELVDEACRFMSRQGKFDEATAKKYLANLKPKL